MKDKQLILDRYQPVQQAGAGGFGTVVKAWDTRIQRWVAVKTIQLSERDAARAAQHDAVAPRAADAAQPISQSARRALGAPEQATAAADDPYAFTPPWEQFPEDPGFLDAVDARHEREHDKAAALDALSAPEPVRELANLPGLDEARTAAMLQDANIVQVYDFEVRDAVAYLIMEYVDGISLSKLLHDFDDQLTLNQIAAVFAGVSHALTVAHAHSVLHLDIKPDNVLIDGKGCVKVTDFGLATLADAQGTGYAGGGTIGYMPPEQIDQQPLDERCDEWALASVTYEMLSGENPFRVRQLSQARAAIEESELVLPSLCWDDLDAQADDALFMALDPQPDDRFESVAEFVDDLLPLLGDPEAGSRELAQLVNFQELDDEEDGEDAWGIQPREPFRARVARGASPLQHLASPGAQKALAHVGGLLGSAFVAFFALSNIGALVGADGVAVNGALLTPQVFTGQPVFWVLLAAIAAAGAIKPSWGALAAYESLGACFIANGRPVEGVLFIGVTLLWWYFVGRLQHATANMAFVPALAGPLGLNQVTPLLSGFCLRPLRAVASTAYALVVAAMFAACLHGQLTGWFLLLGAQFGTMSETLVHLLGNAPFWCVAASWLGATAAISLLCGHRSFAVRILGAVLGASALMGGLMAAAWFNSGGASALPPLGDLAFTTVAVLLLFAIVLATGPLEPAPATDAE